MGRVNKTLTAIENKDFQETSLGDLFGSINSRVSQIHNGTTTFSIMGQFATLSITAFKRKKHYAECRVLLT
jgi:hypothetical protein